MASTAPFQLPDWVAPHLAANVVDCGRYDARMRLTIELAAEHVERGTGGPFAAAVFDLESHELIAVGLNLVENSRCSVAHAEVVALTLAQQELGTHDLGAVKGRSFELVSSSEPCIMCLGAVHWSGIRRLVCGARHQDAEAVGFDEGPIAADWVEALEASGVVVRRDVQRAAARSVLRRYARGGGTIYNPTGPETQA